MKWIGKKSIIRLKYQPALLRRWPIRKCRYWRAHCRIRSLGYEAIPCGNDTTQSIPLAIDAGFGELGRNGLLITPEFGPRQRICKVLTNLPLVADKPIDFGMQSYCETCHACGFACPAKAIVIKRTHN